MRSVLLLLLVITSVPLWGQMIDNRQCNAFSDDPFFNTDFIRRNKIKYMHGKLSGKAEMRPIRKKGLVQHYAFDEAGKLQMQYTSFFRAGKQKDTTSVYYHYDSLDHMITKRRNDVHGFFSYNYQWDSLGNMTQEKYCRDVNAGPSKDEFKLGKQFEIVSETFSYEKVNERQFKKRFYNSYGKAYKEEISHYNEMGYLTEQVTKLIISSRGSKVTYEYNEKGLVSKKTDYSNLTFDNEISYEYSYDDLGNLIEENIYRNGKHITLRQFLYDGNMLIKAQLTKDIETNFITIIEYECGFYEEEVVEPEGPSN